jgi:hypothetical protein
MILMRMVVDGVRAAQDELHLTGSLELNSEINQEAVGEVIEF